ncbi:putative tat pathway signal sequence protein [Botrytis fragariae]|uniref:Putative tat pathway signal sequence protein n=1 Tax=Botrytis fragariae TaxID=1964551 RepID=A0A8H6EDS5_9HELO|nr:putative tat pathway signal sequence protein [Botrytis fragariae]KAF5868413.1 putative tat pathway signal sequence protein [Botrytis fragariae]
MTLFLRIFNPQAERWADQHRANKASMESEENLLPKAGDDTEVPRSHKSLNGTTRVVITVITLLLWGAAAFVAGSMTSKTHRDSPLGSAENGFVEELIITPSETFKLIQTRFTGGVDFSPEGIEVLAPSIYVGEPSLEIDEAWNAIIGGESHYFSVSEEEARRLWGTESDRYRDRIRGGWTGTLDMFHCLHCLNQLRKALRRDIYPEEEHRGMIHQLHCIDHLRQVIMCQGSSVISPSEWHDERGQYINPKQVHTCRAFEKLHEFSKARYNGSIAVPRGPKMPLHPHPSVPLFT